MIRRRALAATILSTGFRSSIASPSPSTQIARASADRAPDSLTQNKSKPRKKTLFDFFRGQQYCPNGQLYQRCLVGHRGSPVAADRDLRIGSQDSLSHERIQIVSDESADEK